MNEPTTRPAKTLSLKEYIEYALSMVTRDFKIRLTEDEVCYIRSLKSEDAVDRCVHDWIMKKL